MLTTKEVRERITEENEFDCISKGPHRCELCPFITTAARPNCGGRNEDFYWKSMKSGAETELKDLLRYKAKGNNKEYPNLK